MNQVEAMLYVDASPSILWGVVGGTVKTALNEPYRIEMEIASEQLGADPLQLLGSSSSLVLKRGFDENVFGGIVSSVRVSHDHGSTVRAALVIEPALAALRHGRDTRIFQEKNVPTVLEEVLTEALSPYGRKVQVDLTRTYPDREYTVQYQESNFDFVHRLMEEEGILYYFAAGDDGIETMVLLDVPQQHPQVPGEAVFEYSNTVGDASLLGDEYLRRFEPVSAIVGTEVATRHFDWTHPSALINGQADAAHERETPNGSSHGPARESYEHDEAFTLHEYAQAYRAHDVTDQQRIRREQQARDTLKYVAEGSVSRIRPGVRFEVNGHPSVGLNAEYVVIRATHRFGSHEALEEKIGSGPYGNRFWAVPADVIYRPTRVRARPRVHGVQTAIVTGPPGEEIHTDERGRVKVQFHWDRHGEMNERTTCWIRCTQSWAGAGWGAWILPRVGMEVVVSFIDGDLDRPLITGCVYNGDNPNPYPLPDKKMVSTFKTNSYPGGDGYNELRFDDTKNAEEIWIHGEKDWNTVIENDLNRDVRHDEKQSVTRHRTRKVGVNESVQIGANQTLAVVANQNTMVGVNRIVEVGMHKKVVVGESIELVCGKSRILMTKEGLVRIEGSEFQFGATGEVWVAGSLIHLN